MYKKFNIIFIFILLFVSIVHADCTRFEFDTPEFNLPYVQNQTIESYEEYFKEFFEENDYDIRGQAREYKYAAYAAMSIKYIEESIGRKLTYSEILAGAWFSEAGVVWMYDETHPIVNGTKEALAHQINSYCGGLGAVTCPPEYVLLTLGIGWQAFRYNINANGVMPQGDNIAAFLTTNLNIYEQGKSFGVDILELSAMQFSCNDAWSIGILDLEHSYEIGDYTNTGYIYWLGELPASINPFIGYEHAIINSCGIRLK